MPVYYLRNDEDLLIIVHVPCIKIKELFENLQTSTLSNSPSKKTKKTGLTSPFGKQFKHQHLAMPRFN